LLIFKTNEPQFFAKKEKLLFKNYLTNNNIDYYVLFEKNILIAAGGFGLNPKTKSIDLTWGMTHREFQKKGFGTNLLDFRIRKITEKFPNKNITLNTSQKTFKFYEKFGFELQKITKNYYWHGLDRYDMIKYPLK
tara:strand:+ start:3214 stop:3618 length:405 start_codon:yes stop_codon:yes gene_type:complete